MKKSKLFLKNIYIDNKKLKEFDIDKQHCKIEIFFEKQKIKVSGEDSNWNCNIDDFIYHSEKIFLCLVFDS